MEAQRGIINKMPSKMEVAPPHRMLCLGWDIYYFYILSRSNPRSRIQRNIYKAAQEIMLASSSLPHWMCVTKRFVGFSSVPYNSTNAFKFVPSCPALVMMLWKRNFLGWFYVFLLFHLWWVVWVGDHHIVQLNSSVVENFHRFYLARHSHRLSLDILKSAKT